MFDDITKFAALVSTSLRKVDRDTISSTSGGPANRIDMHKFVNPPMPGTEAPPSVPVQPVVQPQFVPPMEQPMVVGRVETFQEKTQATNITTIDNNVIVKIAESLQDIATELNKINKKLVSVQKYYNQQLNKNDNTLLNET